MLTEEEKNAGLTGRIIPINIEEQMKSAYIDYSMSVIVSRALPDVRDGMKPVHRRILYDMSAEPFWRGFSRWLPTFPAQRSKHF